MIVRTIQIELTPNELASCFCEMSSEEQAMFFNKIAALTNEWNAPFPFQLEAISGEQGLTDSGRYVMSLIGECSSQCGQEDTKKLKANCPYKHSLLRGAEGYNFCKYCGTKINKN